MAQTCGDCGSAVAAGDSFCGQCGKPVSGATARESRSATAPHQDGATAELKRQSPEFAGPANISGLDID